MADYYPLLSKTIANLPNATPEIRRAIFDRARQALLGQLENSDPPASAEIIAAELAALDTAAERIELDFAEPVDPGAGPGPATTQEPEAEATANAAPDAEPARAPRPAPPVIKPPPSRIVPPPAATRPAAPPPARMPEAPASAAPAVDNPKISESAKTTEAPSFAASRGPEESDSAPPIAPLPPASRAQTARSQRPPPSVSGSSEGAAAANRPTTAHIQQQRGGGRKSRMPLIASLLGVFVLAAAVLGYFSWKWRLLPEAFTTTRIAGQSAPASNSSGQPGDPGKVDGRAESGAAGRQEPAEAPARQPATREVARAPAQTPPAQDRDGQAIAISQRAAFLIQEPTADNNNAVKTYTGSVVWKSQNVSRGSGQPLAYGIRADVNFPEAKLVASMVIEKNEDATLPASHTVTWRFRREEGSPLPEFSEAGMLLMRDESNPQGASLAGVPARITPNDYIIALAAPEPLLVANLDAMKNRGWFDLPLNMAGGLQAKITLEKGRPGDRLLAEAYERWGHDKTAEKAPDKAPAQSDPNSAAEEPKADQPKDDQPQQ